MGWLQELDAKVRDVLNPSIEVRRQRHEERMERLQHKLDEQKLKEEIFESRHKVDLKREELRKKRDQGRENVKRLPEFSNVLFGPEQVRGGEKKWTPK